MRHYLCALLFIISASTGVCVYQQFQTQWSTHLAGGRLLSTGPPHGGKGNEDKLQLWRVIDDRLLVCACVCALVRQTHTQISSCSVLNMGPQAIWHLFLFGHQAPWGHTQLGTGQSQLPLFENAHSQTHAVLPIRSYVSALLVSPLSHEGSNCICEEPTEEHPYLRCMCACLCLCHFSLSHRISKKKWLWQEKKMLLISVKPQLHLWAERVNRHNIDTETRIKRRKVFKPLCSMRIKVILLLYYVPFATVCEVRLNKLKWHLSCLLEIP